MDSKDGTGDYDLFLKIPSEYREIYIHDFCIYQNLLVSGFVSINLDTLSINWINFNKLECGDVLCVSDSHFVISRCDAMYGYSGLDIRDLDSGTKSQMPLKNKMQCFLFSPIYRLKNEPVLVSTSDDRYFDVEEISFSKLTDQETSRANWIRLDEARRQRINSNIPVTAQILPFKSRSKCIFLSRYKDSVVCVTYDKTVNGYGIKKIRIDDSKQLDCSSPALQRMQV